MSRERILCTIIGASALVSACESKNAPSPVELPTLSNRPSATATMESDYPTRTLRPKPTPPFPPDAYQCPFPKTPDGITMIPVDTEPGSLLDSKTIIDPLTQHRETMETFIAQTTTFQPPFSPDGQATFLIARNLNGKPVMLYTLRQPEVPLGVPGYRVNSTVSFPYLVFEICDTKLLIVPTSFYFR